MPLQATASRSDAGRRVDEQEPVLAAGRRLRRVGHRPDARVDRRVVGHPPGGDRGELGAVVAAEPHVVVAEPGCRAAHAGEDHEPARRRSARPTRRSARSSSAGRRRGARRRRRRRRLGACTRSPSASSTPVTESPVVAMRTTRCRSGSARRAPPRRVPARRAGIEPAHRVPAAVPLSMCGMHASVAGARYGDEPE